MRKKINTLLTALALSASVLQGGEIVSDGIRYVERDDQGVTWVEGTKVMVATFKYGDVKEPNVTAAVTFKDGVPSDSVVMYGKNKDHRSSDERMGDKDMGIFFWVHEGFTVFYMPSAIGEPGLQLWSSDRLAHNLDVLEQSLQDKA